MALQVRRIVTGHDANGKAIVQTDERLTGRSRAGRAGIQGCEIWSTDRMPVDNSDAAAVAQREGLRQALQLRWLGPGHGRPHHRVRARLAQVHAPHRDGGLRDPVVR